MKTLHKISLAGLASIMMIGVGCKKSFLTPQPLSIYTPENTFINAAGLQDALVACARNLRNEYYGDGAPWLMETVFSEECVEGTDDKAGPAVDLNLLITPTAIGTNDTDHSRVQYYWDEGYKGIKYANTVVTRIDVAKWASDAQRNLVLGSAYFQRAMRYYRMCNQFGDIPVTLQEVASPKLDYYSTKRSVILQRMKSDLEFAAKWGSDNVNRGEVTLGGINHLLTKVNMSLGLFDDAIASANAVINGGVYSLMTTRFGAFTSDATKNIIWDLHRPENKSIAANKEGLYMIIDRLGYLGGFTGSNIMRNTVPQFYATGVHTPNGNAGTTDLATAAISLSNMYGRGIGRNRETSYTRLAIWNNDPGDYRHAPGNWMNMTDMVYNNPNLITQHDPYYGQNLVLFDGNGNSLIADTIRCSFSWPHYKLYVADTENTPMTGGHTDWYVFRLAETYLLRAECYYWKGDLPDAYADINRIRARANAPLLTDPSQVNMGVILDERARELYWEEPRKTELTRIAFLYAQTGKPCEIFGGKVYTQANFSTDNFYYDRVISKNVFYKNGVVNLHGDKYTMSPYHVLWPIPQTAINANTLGHINQNAGYSGFSSNVPALTSIPQ